MLRLAAASVRDDDAHGAAALVRRACVSADWSAEVLDQGVALLAGARLWPAVVEVAGDRWRADVHGPAAGADLVAALVSLKEIDRADDVLHQLGMELARRPDLDDVWRPVLRRQEFELDGLRVTRDVAVSFTVRLDRFLDNVLPTPLWRSLDLDLPPADGPRIAVVPLAFSEESPEHRELARGLALWLGGVLRVGGDADVSSHVETNVRGPVVDTHVRHTRDLMLDLTGLAGHPAFLVGGAVLGQGQYRGLDIDIWRPDGHRVRLRQHLGDRPGAGLRRLPARVGDVCGVTWRPDAPALPPARLLERLVPAYSDALPVVLAGGGGLRPQLVDRRRDRLDQLLALAQAFPAELEPRLLLYGLLHRMTSAGSPIPQEYWPRAAALPALPRSHPALDQLTGRIGTRTNSTRGEAGP
jgi:hypothetical protein